MLAGILLSALASLAPADHAGCRGEGNVIHVSQGKALVCVGNRSASGNTHKVRRLVPAPGAPGRLPFFVWTETGQVRIDRVEGRVAEATVVGGSVREGHKLMLD